MAAFASASASASSSLVHRILSHHISTASSTTAPHLPPSAKPIEPNAACRLTPPLSIIPYSSSTPRHPLAASAAAAAAYGTDEDDDDDDEDEDEDEEVEEEGEGDFNPKAATKRRDEVGRLYVGNLPYSMTPSQLADVFGQAGAVAAVEVVYDRVTDRSRGFAFVTMATAEDARQAIRMFDGSQVGGRTVKVNFPEVPRGGERAVMGPRARGGGSGGGRGFVESPHKVYAGNLGWSVTSESLRRAFEGLPGLLGARVVYDRDSGRSRGFGFVSFASQQDALSALDAMNAVEVEGRPLRLNLAGERAAAGANVAASSLSL